MPKMSKTEREIRKYQRWAAEALKSAERKRAKMPVAHGAVSGFVEVRMCKEWKPNGHKRPLCVEVLAKSKPDSNSTWATTFSIEAAKTLRDQLVAMLGGCMTVNDDPDVE